MTKEEFTSAIQLNIQSGKEARKLKEAQELEMKERMEASERYRAKEILETIPEIVKNAAYEGWYSCNVMELISNRDYESEGVYRTNDPENCYQAMNINSLKVAAKMVYDYCKDFNPTINYYWYESDGSKSGWNIEIHWE